MNLLIPYVQKKRLFRFDALLMILKKLRKKQEQQAFPIPWLPDCPRTYNYPFGNTFSFPKPETSFSKSARNSTALA